MSNVPAVAIHGFSSGTLLLSGIQILVGTGLGAAIVRIIPTLKKIANEREANLLSERASEMNKMRDTIDKLEARLDAKDIQHEAERAADRHRINNLDQALKAFFILVKRHPEDAAGAAAEIEAMRAQQMEEEKREGVALRALVATLTTGKPASAS